MKLLETTDGSYDLSSRTANRRGIDALEYLLFAKNYDMTCSTVIAPKGWKALTDSQRAAARCKFAGAVVDDLTNQVKILTDAWDQDQASSFLSADWLKAGKGGSIASTKAALNLLSDSMFYLHDVVMDVKLGAALGIKDNSCSIQDKPCLADLESKHAGFNKEMLIANLQGFQSLLTGQNPEGKQGQGFDDVLTELDAKDLGEDMVKKTAAAISALEAIKGTIAEALESDYASVANAHKAIVAVVKVMKTEFMMTVGLEIPKEAAGDND